MIRTIVYMFRHSSVALMKTFGMISLCSGLNTELCGERIPQEILNGI
jgi:hypothetical protein